MPLDVLLARPGLPASFRLLVAAAVAIWAGDWSRLHDCITRARGLGCDRAELEETLLQAVLFCGFPRVVTAFETLASAWPVATPPTGGALPQAEQAAAGAALFAGIYGQNTPAVDAMLRGFHADFHAFVFEVAYGRILTRPRLTARERELLAVGLLAAQDQVRQFAGHARGALHFGATRAELREVVVTALGDVVAVDDWCARIR
jgi:alkylhydroperoxidase/carboxymuconolactone decarboxylase family protein YurZ